MYKVFLSIGSNKGWRINNLKRAINYIKKIDNIKYIKESPVYETKPMYNLEQNFFLNLIVEINTTINQPDILLDKFKNIEKKMGRNKTILRNGPRIIDIDILDYNNIILKNRNLTLPHPSIKERIFVLKPWSDIAPNYKLPYIRKNIYQLMSDMKLDADIIKLYTEKK